MPPVKIASATATWPSRCDSCHSIPSSVYCHADAAYLCTLCDSSVHSANPLARRHHRVPLLPIASACPKEEEDEEHPEDDKDCFFIEGEVDQYFDLVEFSTSCEEEEGKENFDCREEEEKQMLQSSFNLEGFKAGIDYSAFLPHTESISSVEATVVPENSISSSEFRTSKGTIELFSGPPIQVPQQFTAMDREARVLRYREKRKTRKFQKIIRYASRKAYAETRPRIKGRFAKRTDAELEVDQMFAAPVMAEAGYGVVHSY